MSDDHLRVTSASGKMMRDSTQDEVSKERKRKNEAGQGENLPVNEAEKETSQAENKNTQEDLDEAVEKINDYVQNVQRDIHFSVDQSTGQSVVKVLDSDSKEVIRQIPSEVAINLAQNLQKYGRLIKIEV